MADAVWLTSIAQGASRPRPESERGPGPARPPATAEAPARTKTADRATLGDSPPESRVEPGDIPIDPARESPLLFRHSEGGAPADRAEVKRSDDEVPHVLPVDLGGGAAPPARSYLPGSADIVRALRPLKRKVRSRRADEITLDEDATAEQAVQDGLWFPVTKPAMVRWLDLTLVVDTSPSMVLWLPTVRTVTSLLERLGVFRSIQIRLLDTHEPPEGHPATPVLRGGTPGTPTRDPAELLDRSGRRILLVLTDGVSQCWRHDLVSPLLAKWGGSMPVAVVHLLPQRLWGRGGLALHRARLTVPCPLGPNRRWGLELSDAWLAPDPASALPAGVVPVPVLELGARWLGWWAHLVTRAHWEPVEATVLLASDHAPEPASRQDSEHGFNGSVGRQPSADEQVQNFLSVASPPAFRLATLLAAVPVSLPAARLVQSELVPESGPDHLAEVFISGLLRPPAGAGRRAWETGTFDFDGAVRGVLLSGARRSETAHVVRLVTERLDDRHGVLRHFRAALDAPDSTPDPELTTGTAHHVAIERMVMRALSGPYLSRADRLQLTKHDFVPASGPPATSLGGTRVNNPDTLTAVTDHMVRTPRPSSPVLDPPAGAAEHEDESAASAAARPHPLAEFAPVVSGERQASEVPPVWGSVPPRNPNFTGRAEPLERLSERLTAGGATAVLPKALHGMGGIGKTQIAVEYIYRHLQDYDIIWWIQATHPAQIRAGLTELAQRLGLPGSSDEAHTAVPAVREALRIGRPFRRWLLVFDSAENPEMVRPFFPTNGPGEILVTSKNPAWAGVARPLEVAVFTREESKELLQRRGPEIDDREADRLADKLGDLPLAIEQAAAWRAETGMPVEEYLRLFDEKAAEILDTSAPPDYEVSVAAAWNVSFDELRTRNPAAHQLLQVCAFFAPEPISRSLFVGVRGVSVSPELDAVLRDPMQLSRTIRDISRYGLAKIDHRNDTLQLHRLVQAVLSNRMTAQRWEKMRHGAHLLLANLDPNDPVPSRQWPRYQDVLPHAYAAKVIECNDRWVRHLVVNLMEFLYFWGDHEEAAKLARQAVDVWSERLGEADPQTLEAAGNLGFYLWVLGRYTEAAELNKRTVELHRHRSGENSEETVRAELAVATDLKGRGDFVAALELNKQIYQKSKGLFGNDEPITLMTAHDLVVSLGLAGAYREGRELGEESYRRRTDVLGHDNLRTMNTLSAVILARRESGDYGWARANQEELAERSRELFGADKAATLPFFHHLAVARRKDGDHRGARELSTQVLEQFRLRYGHSHPSTMASALAQTIDLRQTDDLRQAHKLGEQTSDRYRDSLGEHHPHTLAALIDLAVTLRLLGDAATARQLDERSLEQLRAALGPDHPYAIVGAVNLASDLAALGETEAALPVGTEVLDRANRVLGADHPTTLAAVANFVLDLRILGRTQEAETRYAEVLTRYRRVLGDVHPATMAAAGGVRADCDIDPLPL